MREIIILLILFLILIPSAQAITIATTDNDYRTVEKQNQTQ